MKKFSKKGMGLGDLPMIAAILMVVVIMFALAVVVLASFKSTTVVMNNADANDTIAAGITAVKEYPTNWLLITVIVLAVAILLGIIIGSLWKNINFNGGR